MIHDHALIEQCQDEVDQALHKLAAAHVGDGFILDWTVSVERDDGEGNRSFLVFTSPTMTSWKLLGFAKWTKKRLQDWGNAVLYGGYEE